MYKLDVHFQPLANMIANRDLVTLDFGHLALDAALAPDYNKGPLLLENAARAKYPLIGVLLPFDLY